MGNILNKPVLQEYISSGQSQMMADPTDYVDANGNRKLINSAITRSATISDVFQIQIGFRYTFN